VTTVLARTVMGKPVAVDVNELVQSVHVYSVAVRGGRILIVPQWVDDGFDFPGGHVELGEEHLDALIRETREESGFTIQPGEVIAVTTTFFIHPRTGRKQHCTLIYFAAEILGGEISTSGFTPEEQKYARMARFVTLDELKGMRFMSEQKSWGPILGYLERKLGAK